MGSGGPWRFERKIETRPREHPTRSHARPFPNSRLATGLIPSTHLERRCNTIYSESTPSDHACHISSFQRCWSCTGRPCTHRPNACSSLPRRRRLIDVRLSFTTTSSSSSSDSGISQREAIICNDGRVLCVGSATMPHHQTWGGEGNSELDLASA